MEWLDFWQTHRGFEIDSSSQDTLYVVFNEKGKMAILRQWIVDEECDYWIPDPQTDELLPSTLSQFFRFKSLKNSASI